VAGVNGCGSIHACGWGSHPCQFWVDLIGFGARRRDTMIFIYLKMIFICLKCVVISGVLKSMGSLLLCYITPTGQPVHRYCTTTITMGS
jgi:hypothetical protein